MVLLALPRESAAFNVRVAWATVTGASGYRLYVRTSATSYGTPVDLGARTPDADGVIRYVHGGLTASDTYYFKITSYAGRTESVPSNEIALPYAAVAKILDSDADGLTDAVEDRDLDMVTDANETDRRRADTDADGVDDGAEVANGTNPLDATDPAASAGPCARAALVPPAGGNFTGTTSGTSALRGTCATAADAPEKVYRWTPQSSGLATIETCSGTGTSFDTVLYLRRADCAAGQELGCNDDTATCVTAEPSTYHGSRLAPMVTAGETYFIVVDGAGVSGSFSLHVAAPTTPVPTVTPTPTRTAAATVTATPQRTATQTPQPTSTPKPTATVTAKPTATVTPQRTATATPQRTATATPLRTTTPVATSTATPVATITATTTATRTPQPTGTSTRNGTPTPVPTGACGNVGTIPAAGGTFSGTTGTSMGYLAGSCAATRNSLEAVYRWTPTASGVATLDTCGSSFDTVLYVRKGDCLGGAEVSCNNDSTSCPATKSGKSTGSMLRLAVTAGETYFVVVDGRNGASGIWKLAVTTPAPTTSVALVLNDVTGAASPVAVPNASARTNTTAASDAAAIDLTATADAPYLCRRWRRDESANGTVAAERDEAPRGLCMPISTEPLPVPLLARYRVGDEVAPPAGELRVATALGEVAVEVLASSLVEVPATTEPAPRAAASIRPASDAPSEPETCYDVRPLADASERTVVLASTAGPQRYRAGRPTRLCMVAAPAEDGAPLATRLCYRIRRSGDAAGVAAEPMKLTSALGTASGALGAVEELCLSSEVVADAP